MIFVLTNDFGGVSRGRALVCDEFDGLPGHGVGWVPANQAISPFDTIGDNPFGSHGDLRLYPDSSAQFVVDLPNQGEKLRFVLSEIKTLAGEGWSCCTRSLLKNAIRRLEVLGFSLTASFEHEFVLLGTDGRQMKFGPAFSLASYDELSGFARQMIDALRQCGLKPELFLPEFGPGQVEIPISPSGALRAADEAVVFREIARKIARMNGMRCSFSPKLNLESVGSGVHVHFSISGLDGKPVNHDPERDGGVSRTAGSFCAGILRHARSMSAICAPSVVSYYRLKPHSWSNAYTCFGLQNREATVRICPTPSPDLDPFHSHHFEYRAVDATASPYLVLAALIHAGIDGLTQDLPAPPLLNSDPDSLTEDERVQLGIQRMPEDLNEALKLFTEDELLSQDFGTDFLACYKAMKAAEMDFVKSDEPVEVCRKYMEVY